jgi:hypothetical protein
MKSLKQIRDCIQKLLIKGVANLTHGFAQSLEGIIEIKVASGRRKPLVEPFLEDTSLARGRLVIFLEGVQIRAKNPGLGHKLHTTRIGCGPKEEWGTIVI